MIETLIVIGGVIGVTVIGLFVFGRNTNRPSSRIYGLMTLSFILLMLANLFTLGGVEDPSVVLWCIRLVALATVSALTFLHLLIRALALESSAPLFGKRINRTIAWASVAVGLLALTPFVFSSVTLGDNREPIVSVAPGVSVFALYSLGLVVLTVIQLAAGLRNRSKKQRGQSKAILIGTLPTLILAPITSFILPVLYNLTWFVALSPLYIVFFIVMVAYAMIRHGLFDVRLAAVRTAAYLLTLISLTAIYIALIYVISQILFNNRAAETVALLNPIAISSALFVALAFQPLKRVFDKITDDLFYKDNYSTGAFIAKINQVLNSTNDLRTLLERTAKVIASTLKAQQVFFFVTLPEERYISAGTDRHTKIAPGDLDIINEADLRNKTVFLVSQFEVKSAIRRMMVSHRLELIMKLRKGDDIIGYLCLGEPHNIGYTSRDLRALQTIADELAIAIQNSLAVEEIRKLNDTLELRVNAATKELRLSNAQLQRLDEAKDEFISMASHQLRTPLTSIKGYISMLIEGDMGEITPEQKKVLEEAFISSERMVRLIGDFLNVSRLQTGKFVIEKRPVNLARLVQRELDSLASNAATRGQKFEFSPPKDIPELELDEAKIQQVIMNFADNALFYSKDNSKIVVSLKKTDDGFVEFTIKDHGIGVPEKEQQHLFNKFFRATNARRVRPDGTGVGLFLAKKVITDHGGSIIFESKENKGSTFGFRLPLPKASLERGDTN